MKKEPLTREEFYRIYANLPLLVREKPIGDFEVTLDQLYHTIKKHLEMIRDSEEQIRMGLLLADKMLDHINKQK